MRADRGSRGRHAARTSRCSPARRRRSTRRCASARAAASSRSRAWCPRRASALFELSRAGRHAEALALQRQLDAAGTRGASGYGVPGLKAALDIAGYSVGHPARRSLRRRPKASSASADFSSTPRSSLDCASRQLEVHVTRSARHRERILLGPGPSPVVAARDARDGGAGRSATSIRRCSRCSTTCARSCVRLFRAPRDSFAFAVSGTGTAGHGDRRRQPRRAPARRDGRRDRLLRRSARADVRALRRDGHAPRRRVGPGVRSGGARASARASAGATSWRWCTPRRRPASLNPVGELRAIAREHGALTIVDAVTSFGGMPLDVGAWGIDACYSCTQKCLGAPSGLAPVVFAPARARAPRCRAAASTSISRCSRTTGSAASTTTRCRRRSSTRSHEALAVVEEEGLEARWARHRTEPPRARRGAERARPVAAAARGRAAVDAQRGARAGRRGRGAPSRVHLLDAFNIEIGAGLGPLAGKIWRVGLMGASSSPR